MSAFLRAREAASNSTPASSGGLLSGKRTCIPPLSVLISHRNSQESPVMRARSRGQADDGFPAAQGLVRRLLRNEEPVTSLPRSSLTSWQPKEGDSCGLNQLRAVGIYC